MATRQPSKKPIASIIGRLHDRRAKELQASADYASLTPSDLLTAIDLAAAVYRGRSKRFAKLAERLKDLPDVRSDEAVALMREINACADATQNDEDIDIGRQLEGFTAVLSRIGSWAEILSGDLEYRDGDFVPTGAAS